MIYHTVDKWKCLFVLQADVVKAEQHLLLNKAFSWCTSCCWRSLPLPAAMAMLLQTSVSRRCCPWDSAERFKFAAWEGDVFMLHVPASEIVVLLRIRTLKHGGFSSVAKTIELFMRFGGWLAYEKESLMMGESSWNMRLSLTHMVSHLVQTSQAQACTGEKGQLFYSCSCIFSDIHFTTEFSVSLWEETSFSCTKSFPKTVFLPEILLWCTKLWYSSFSYKLHWEINILQFKKVFKYYKPIFK